MADDLYLQVTEPEQPKQKERRSRCRCGAEGRVVTSIVVEGTKFDWRGRLTTAGRRVKSTHACVCTALTEHWSGVCFLCRGATHPNPDGWPDDPTKGTHSRLRLQSTGALHPAVKAKIEKAKQQRETAENT